MALKRHAADDDEASGRVPTKRSKESNAVNCFIKIAHEINHEISNLEREQIKQILMDVEKEVEDEMENDARLPRSDQLGAKRSSPTVAEMYSPPRVTSHAAEFGLKSSWALDLQTHDDDGREWDFNEQDMRERAMAKIDEDKPMLVILSPMCAPFSQMQNIN